MSMRCCLLALSEIYLELDFVKIRHMFKFEVINFKRYEIILTKIIVTRTQHLSHLSF